MKLSQYSAQQRQQAAPPRYVARIVVAMTLVLALLSGIAPLESVSFADAPECSMSCCVGLPPHGPGECASILSCHVKVPGHADAAHDASHVEQHAASSHADADANAHQHETQTTTHHAHTPPTGQTGTHHAETQEAAHASPTNEPHDESEMDSQRGRHTSISPASVSNPCSPDCGMAAGSFGNNVRTRDAATSTRMRRPRRMPSRVVTLRRLALRPPTAAGKYRLAPPRAPPATLNSTSA